MRAKGKSFLYPFPEESGVYRNEQQVLFHLGKAFPTCVDGLIVLKNTNNKWTLTHRGSGRRVCYVDSVRMGQWIAGALSYAQGWEIESQAEVVKAVNLNDDMRAWLKNFA